jgi:hypothetical protein
LRAGAAAAALISFQRRCRSRAATHQPFLVVIDGETGPLQRRPVLGVGEQPVLDPLDVCLDAVGRRDEVVEVHDRGDPVPLRHRDARDLQIGLVDREQVEPAGDPHVRLEPGLDDEDAAGCEVSRHRVDGGIGSSGPRCADRAEEAGDGVELAAEVEAPHVALVERNRRAEALARDREEVAVEVEALDLELVLLAPRGACPCRRRRRAACVRTGCARGSAPSACRVRGR